MSVHYAGDQQRFQIVAHVGPAGVIYGAEAGVLEKITYKLYLFNKIIIYRVLLDRSFIWTYFSCPNMEILDFH